MANKTSTLIALLLPSAVAPISRITASEYIRITPDDGQEYAVHTMSGDGQVVVGRTNDSSWRWDRQQRSFVDLDFTTPREVSFDGSVIVGSVRNEVGTDVALWTETDGFNLIEQLPGRIVSFPQDISDDGDLIVGFSWNEDFREPWFWSDGDGYGLLDSFREVPTERGVETLRLSGNGQYLAGYVRYQPKGAPRVSTGYIWNTTDGIELLPTPDIGPLDEYPLDTHPIRTSPRNITNDGTVVGDAFSGPFDDPRRIDAGIVWYGDGSIEVIQPLANRGHALVRAYMISEDGQLVLGTSRSAGDSVTEAEWFAWTKQGGTQDLSAILRDEYGVELPEEADIEAMSSDRRVLAGDTWDRTEAWLIQLDWPLGSLREDFSLDNLLNEDDADLLASAIVAASVDPLFDLNGNDLVTIGDLEHYLELTNRLNGDADFSGRVDVVDFLTLSRSFGGDALWTEGDFDANGTVDVSDFLILSNNFGQISATVAVPEPSTAASSFLSCVALWAIVRRRR